MKFFRESAQDSHYDEQYFKKSLPLEDKQNLLDKLLIEFDNFSKKYNTLFWLDYGTLLGAYRHRGIIPWDDDVDVGMREDDLLLLPKYFETDSWVWKVNPYRGLDEDNTVSARLIDKNTGTFIDVFSYRKISNKEWIDSCNIRAISENMLFPLKKLKFNEKVYSVPNQTRDLLVMYYTDISIPKKYRKIELGIYMVIFIFFSMVVCGFLFLGR
jgi:phosphorylcholine metabolism protein LicD